MGNTKQRSSRGSSATGLRIVGCATLVAVSLIAVSGCCHHGSHDGWDSSHKIQVQFYSPPGAEVTVKRCLCKRHVETVTTFEGLDHRLEVIPEEYAIFNLCSGTYKFQYTTAKGFPGVYIYGELDVRNPCDSEVRKFVRQSFIPMQLPSRYYLHARPLHPVTGPSGAGLNEIAVEQIAQGDLIDKVYFVADLDTAYDDIRRINARLGQLRSAETVLNSSRDYLNARHADYRRDSIYADPTASIDDAAKEFWGKDRKFNKLEADRERLENKRYELRQQVDDLVRERRIRRTLLDSMRIINRSGALVLATPEFQWPYHDAEEQVSRSRKYDSVTVGPGSNYHLGAFKLNPLGKVVAVLRVGGRHMHWDNYHTAVAAGPVEQEYTTIEHREEVRTSAPRMIVD